MINNQQRRRMIEWQSVVMLYFSSKATHFEEQKLPKPSTIQLFCAQVSNAAKVSSRDSQWLLGQKGEKQTCFSS